MKLIKNVVAAGIGIAGAAVVVWLIKNAMLVLGR